MMRPVTPSTWRKILLKDIKAKAPIRRILGPNELKNAISYCEYYLYLKQMEGNYLIMRVTFFATNSIAFVRDFDLSSSLIYGEISSSCIFNGKRRKYGRTLMLAFRKFVM